MDTQEPINYDIPVNEGLDVEVSTEVAEDLDPIILALKKEREALGLTQWEVAQRMGYASPSRVSQLETGENDLQLSTLRAWAATLGLEILARAPKGRQGRPRTNFR